MLFKRAILEGISAGRITLAFRKWRQCRVRAGSEVRTPLGVVAIGSVAVVTRDSITQRQAVQAGYASLAALLRDLDRQPAGTLYRLTLRFAGADPRIALRQQTKMSAEELTSLRQRLDRFDRASRRGPWTADVLNIIAMQPGVRAADLASQLGRDTAAFKADVRKLKDLGLTESLDVGYRLSPRGRRVVKT